MLISFPSILARSIITVNVSYKSRYDKTIFLHLSLIFQCLTSKISQCSLCGSADPKGGGEGFPLKYHKNIGFLSNTGPVPLKIINLHSM